MSNQLSNGMYLNQLVFTVARSDMKMHQNQKCRPIAVQVLSVICLQVCQLRGTPWELPQISTSSQHTIWKLLLLPVLRPR